MNKMASIKRAPSPDYDVDGYGWAVAQATMIREGRIEEIDWENVAEEIESVGKQERSEYVSHMIRVLQHMIKWQVQPERQSISWWLSIMNGRADAERVLDRNPSLKPILDEMHVEALKYARRKAAAETGADPELIEGIAILRKDAVDLEIARPESE